jgi:hypothetical protein
MRAGTIWRTRAVPTRQGPHHARTRDHRLRSLPTKHGHAARLITIGAIREYQSDSSSKRPAASALSHPTHKHTERPPPLDTGRSISGTRYPIPFIRGANTGITISPLWWRPDCFPRHCFAIGLSCPPIASDRYDRRTSPKWVTAPGSRASRFPSEDGGHVSPSPS